MNKAEEWQEWQRSLGVPIVMGTSSGHIPLTEVKELIANEKGRGRGLLAIGPLPDDPAEYEGWDALDEAQKRNPHFVPQVMLLFGEPDTWSAPSDPAAITFTVEDAVARVKEMRSYGRRVQMVGPITDIRGALMTLAEVDALVDHGIPPKPAGTVPGGLVILVVVHGDFELYPPIPNSKPISHSVAYEVFNIRTGHIFRSGSGNKDIVLP